MLRVSAHKAREWSIGCDIIRLGCFGVPFLTRCAVAAREVMMTDRAKLRPENIGSSIHSQSGYITGIHFHLPVIANLLQFASGTFLN